MKQGDTFDGRNNKRGMINSAFTSPVGLAGEVVVIKIACM